MKTSIKTSYYQQMKRVALSGKSPYMQAFTKDLTEYDREGIKGQDEFFWFLRDTGTHLFRKHNDYAATVEEKKATAKCYMNHNERYFHAHDGILQEVSRKEMVVLIEDLIQAWDAEEYRNYEKGEQVVRFHPLRDKEHVAWLISHGYKESN